MAEETTQKTGTLINISVNKSLKTEIQIDGLILYSIIGVIVIYLITRIIFGRRFKKFEVNEAEFGIGKQKVKIRPNIVDMQIAYKIWVELSTRKIGLPIDFNNDVISEVYDSWYKFFSVTRDLVKEVPVSKFRRSDTERIIKMSIEVLNSGIRPHLTLWQAKFRRWYENELSKDENIIVAPQKIQSKFPEFDLLCTDLKEINGRLIKYRSKMYDLIRS